MQLKRGRPTWMDEVDGLLTGTGCVITGGEALRTERGNEVIEVSCLSHTLRCVRENITLGRRAGGTRRHVTAPDGFVREQTLRRARLLPGDPNRGMQVEVGLARRLRMVRNKSTARRMLFALSQGGEDRTTEWEDIGHTAIRDGLAYATLSLGHDATWRLGELRLKGRRLPEIALAAMAGREVSAVMEVALVADQIVERARNGPEGIVIRCVKQTEAYTGVWRDLGGE